MITAPDRLEQVELRVDIAAAMLTLRPREALILVHRFGLFGRAASTLDGIGRKLGRSKDRIRQIQFEALRKMRHPSRLKRLLSWDRDWDGDQEYFVKQSSGWRAWGLASVAKNDGAPLGYAAAWSGLRSLGIHPSPNEWKRCTGCGRRLLGRGPLCAQVCQVCGCCLVAETEWKVPAA